MYQNGRFDEELAKEGDHSLARQRSNEIDSSQWYPKLKKRREDLKTKENRNITIVLS